MKVVVGKLFPSLQVRKLGLAASGGRRRGGEARARDKRLVVTLSGHGTWPGIPFARSKVLASKV